MVVEFQFTQLANNCLKINRFSAVSTRFGTILELKMFQKFEVIQDAIFMQKRQKSRSKSACFFHVRFIFDNENQNL